MSAPKRKREVQLNFRVSPEELALIEQKMAQLGTKNREAYLRKMALDGYVVRLELPELKELVSLMRYSSNNLNQLTRRVHETGLLYTSWHSGPNCWEPSACPMTLSKRMPELRSFQTFSFCKNGTARWTLRRTGPRWVGPRTASRSTNIFWTTRRWC